MTDLQKEVERLKAENEKLRSDINWLMVKLNQSYAENKKLTDALKEPRPMVTNLVPCKSCDSYPCRCENELDAEKEPPMCKHGKSRVRITHLGIDKCNECGEYVPQNALKEPPLSTKCECVESTGHICMRCAGIIVDYVDARKEPQSAKREGCGLCYEGKPCNMAGCPDEVESLKEPPKCEHKWEHWDESKTGFTSHCYICGLKVTTQKEPLESEATKGSGACKHPACMYVTEHGIEVHRYCLICNEVVPPKSPQTATNKKEG